MSRKCRSYALLAFGTFHFRNLAQVVFAVAALGSDMAI